jgi:hypothetical protein
MTGAEWAADEYREMLGANLKRVRQEHDPDCPCGKDEALTEPIEQREAE